MITFQQGNLLEAEVEALVNTVNTVGVMGKGIALMFKERYPENFRAYAQACKAGKVRPGRMFVTATGELTGPRWIINFPTKEHWRNPSRLEWIAAGLEDLVRVIREKNIRSVALPPLGCGQGGLDWNQVRPLIESILGQLSEVQVIAFEPTVQYQNVAKHGGVAQLTVPRALMAETIRRYWVLGIECTLLEIHKLAWFLSQAIQRRNLPDVLDLRFQADRYGPYSHRLNHLLNALDGSYLRANKRVADCTPCDTIAFADEKAETVALFLRRTESRPYLPVLDDVDQWIDGYQSPLGMELLATVHWLLVQERCAPEVRALREALARWPGGKDAGLRKNRLFQDHHLAAAIERLRPLIN
ncbi:macro domain-containing protein [Fontisphaera persica]|uniref:type II toxin-antitoxin system antitoxin DNA ADP-ribosyl glycohydrolase DarG n=1 Tax=Fontisphaera persica TaxID=2974023 RepID=UPI0024BFF348|nr:macro domain-containing protein [Fontisphaera persica]WCJ58801.1 macro domain-containing protein [Fontisphaera persica]